MSGLGISVTKQLLCALRSTPGHHRGRGGQLGQQLVRLGGLHFYTSSSNPNRMPVGDGERKEVEEETERSSPAAATEQTPTPEEPPKKKLSINERLMKMSMESTEDYMKSQGKPSEDFSRFQYNPKDPQTVKPVKASRPRRNEHERESFKTQKSRIPVPEETLDSENPLAAKVVEFHSTTPPKSNGNFIPTPVNPSRLPQPRVKRKGKPEPVVLSEEDVLPKRLDDKDTFGTLSRPSATSIIASSDRTNHQLIEEATRFADQEIAQMEKELSIFTEPETDDYLFVPDDRWTDRKLRFKLKELLEGRRLTEALDIFTGALKDKSYIYDKYNLGYLYALLIIECGKVGHVEMAFRLFRDYVKREITVRPAVFTYLLNACANSPWNAGDNLKRIERLRENMDTHGFLPNEIHYHTMIKAYGRCGDIQSAFSIVDEMMDNEKRDRIRPNSETFAFLLQACISNQENGFRHALVTWKKMDAMNVQPSIYCFNLFLRAVRECGIQIPGGSKSLKTSSNRRQSDNMEDSTTDILPTSSTSIVENSVVTDLIALDEEHPSPRNPELKNLFATNKDINYALSIPENRLALLGGLKAILSQMRRDDVQPDLKTVTELLQIAPIMDVSDVFNLLKKNRIKPDIHIFNLLIKRFMLAHRIEEGQGVLQLMSEYNLQPNVMTWGVLAIGCSSWKTGKSLLMDMDSANLAPNQHILGALLHNACRLYDPRYVLRVMQELLAREMHPDKLFLKDLEKFRKIVQEGILNSETGKEVKPEALKTAMMNDAEFHDYWLKFKLRYDGYMKDGKKILDEEEDDPWAEDYRMRKANLRKHENP